MSKSVENKGKSRSCVWTLIAVPVLLGVAFYTGTRIGAHYKSAVVQGNRGSETSAESHEATTPGSINLTEQARINIGLTTAVTDFRAIEQVVRVPGTVHAHPDRVAFVNTRIEGRIENLLANVGDEVTRGQVLAEVQSRRFGNPIPLVSATAPITGTIVERSASLGASVDPSTPLFKIMDLSIVIVEGELFEDNVPLVKMGQRTRVRLNAYPNETFEGNIVFISSVLDPDKRSAGIWVRLENKSSKLMPEMFGEVAVVVNSNAEAIAVPLDAVIEDDADKFVFVEKGELYQKVEVVTGLSDDLFVEILDGLHPGDVVVTQGNHQLMAVAARPQAGGISDESKPHTH